MKLELRDGYLPNDPAYLAWLDGKSDETYRRYAPWSVTAVPPTVLVADMGNGTMLLQGWRFGPSAYLCAADAAPLREALAAAFGSDVVISDRSAAVQAQP